jgi:hypothetical protein
MMPSRLTTRRRSVLGVPVPGRAKVSQSRWYPHLGDSQLRQNSVRTDRNTYRNHIDTFMCFGGNTIVNPKLNGTEGTVP